MPSAVPTGRACFSLAAARAMGTVPVKPSGPPFSRGMYAHQLIKGLSGTSGLLWVSTLQHKTQHQTTSWSTTPQYLLQLHALVQYFQTSYQSSSALPTVETLKDHSLGDLFSFLAWCLDKDPWWLNVTEFSEELWGCGNGEPVLRGGGCWSVTLCHITCDYMSHHFLCLLYDIIWFDLFYCF